MGRIQNPLVQACLAGLLILAGACHRGEGPRRPAPALRLERDASAPKSSGPPTVVLPAAEAIEVAQAPEPQDAYDWLDDAFYMGDAFGSAPPDYAVVADTVRLWIWRSAADAMQLVEPVGEGFRHYYFNPRSPTPFLVRDGDLAYAFVAARLVAVYDSTGRVLDKTELADLTDEAAKLLQRAEDLRQAALQAPIRRVSATGWAQALPVLAGMQSDWSASRGEQGVWRTTDAAYNAREITYWRAEKERRRRSAERFEHWQKKGFRGSPPAPVEGADRKSEALMMAGLPAPAEAEAR